MISLTVVYVSYGVLMISAPKFSAFSRISACGLKPQVIMITFAPSSSCFFLRIIAVSDDHDVAGLNIIAVAVRHACGNNDFSHGIVMMPASCRKLSIDCFQDIIELRSACRNAGVTNASIYLSVIFVSDTSPRSFCASSTIGSVRDIGLFHNMPGNLNRNIR